MKNIMIGNYVSDDWKMLPSGTSCIKQLQSIFGHNISLYIYFVIDDKYLLTISSSSLREKFESFYSSIDDLYYYETLESAQKAVDTFLLKYDKMKVFL